MRSVFLPCMALSLLANAQQNEVAIILKNEEPSLSSRASIRFEEFMRESKNLFENQNAHLSSVIDQNTQEILAKLEELNTGISYLAAHSSALDSGLAMNKAPTPKEESVTPPKQIRKCSNGPEKKVEPELKGGYNAPYELGLKDPCQVYGQASFLYWKAVQEGMQTYTLFLIETRGVGTGATIRDETYETGAIDFEYKPAFKVGIGGNLPYDNWEIYSEYTWYNHDFADSFNFKGPNSNLGAVHFLANLFPDFCMKPNNFQNYLLIPSTLDSKFNLNLNWIFLELARSFYLGKNLKIRTHFGLRGDRNTEEIIQKFDLATTPTFNGNTTPTWGKSKQSTKAWSIGPRAGFCADYQIPYGLKVYGDLAASILYTKAIQKAKQNSIFFNRNVPDYQTQTISIQTNTIHTATPNLEASIGLGWGSNLNNDRWHLDLSAGYDFIAMWNQNLFRELIIENTVSDAGDGASARTLYRDLFIYGLNVKAGFAF